MSLHGEDHLRRSPRRDRTRPNSGGDVVLKKYQFEYWTDKDDIPIHEPQAYAKALELAKKVINGKVEDPTKGADHYNNPDKEALIMKLSLAPVCHTKSRLIKVANGHFVPVPTARMTNEEIVMRTCFEALRRTLSKSKNPPVDEVIKSGLLTALVQALSVEDEKYRNFKECNGVEALMNLVNRLDSLEVSFARTLAWAFSNMCRHKNPHAPLQVLSVLSKGLAKLVAHSDYPDKQVRQDACWAVSYLTDGPDEQIMLAKTSGIFTFFLMEHRPSLYSLINN
uniref:Hydrolase_2 domain-containing protein n=1 Tax=Heterorhabditis bacteriophora TaxID=37862 RepID=A0A1I7WKD1_HETBA